MTNFKKTPRQVEATKLLAAVKYALLFGGSRSGKTFIAVRNIVIRAAKVKSRHLICRYRFNSVKTSIGMDTLPKVMSLCFPNLTYTLNKTDWYIELPNGSQIWLAGTDDKERTEKVLGTEYSTIYFNESSQFSDWDTVSMLLTRLAENTALKNRAWFDCNPPSKKHWSYQIFIQGKMPNGEPVVNHERDYGHMLMNPGDNIENLPDDYIDMLKGLPKRQRQRFLEGKFLLDIEGALWNQTMIDEARGLYSELWQRKRIVIGVDPATTSNEDSDDWGIGAASAWENNLYSVDADYTRVMSPGKAADAIINAYDKHEADAVVVETNQGGDMVEQMLRDRHFTGRVIKVHASRGKFSRAEPIAGLYETTDVKKCQVAHAPDLDDFEEEITQYVPLTSKKSPNRLDWAVHALTELSGGQAQAGGF